MFKRKKILLVVNPTSGMNSKRVPPEKVIEMFSEDDYEFSVHKTERSGDAVEIVKSNGENNDIIVCCGGDGTFNETVNGVMSLAEKKPLGYLPMGSTNDLANTIGIPTKIKEAVEVIKKNKPVGYDIGRFQNRYFSYIASFGPATKLSYDTPQKLKNIFGHGAYMINCFIFKLIPTVRDVKPVHIKIEHDDGVIDGIFYFVAVSNSTSVAGVFSYDRSTVRLNDGKLEMLLVKNLKSPLESFHMLSKLIRKDYSGDNIMLIRSRNFRLTFDEPHAWTLDGEYGGEYTDVVIETKQKGIDIFCKAGELFE